MLSMSPTWLSPYGAVWHSQYPDAPVPFKQLARFLAPLAKAHTPERITAELSGYLQKTPPQYLNLAKFAATFGSWTPPAPIPPLPNLRWRCCNHPDREITSRYDNKPLCPECVEALP